MSAGLDPSSDRFGKIYLTPGLSSFTEFLAVAAPDLLPGRRPLPAVADLAPHGTTVMALASAQGVVMAGDRRATMGNLIANRELQKVFQADEYSVVGMAGTAGIGVELIRLFQMELEHYEKIEGAQLSVPGKANRLATLVRDNLGAAMQGLTMLPIYAAYDLDAADPDKVARIFSFDMVGGRYEETGFDGIGSGSPSAKAALKKRYRPGLSIDETVRLAVESLYDAADEDTATGGPDLIRKIYPIVMAVTAEGVRRFTDDEVGAVAEAVVRGRLETPGG